MNSLNIVQTILNKQYKSKIKESLITQQKAQRKLSNDSILNMSFGAEELQSTNLNNYTSNTQANQTTSSHNEAN